MRKFFAAFVIVLCSLFVLEPSNLEAGFMKKVKKTFKKDNKKQKKEKSKLKKEVVSKKKFHFSSN